MPDFISPDQWPSNSLDLNPADYQTWGVMQQSMNKTNIDDLQKHLKQTWHYFDRQSQLSMLQLTSDATL